MLELRETSKVWLSVDPGLGGTGWAAWNKHGLIASGTISAAKSRGALWIRRAQSITEKMRQLVDLLGKGQVSHYLYELPQDVGHVASARQDVVKLTTVSGMLVTAVTNNSPGVQVIPVPIPLWKGQLDTMSQILPRVERHIRKNKKRWPRTYHRGLDGRSDHEVDAIGIGLFGSGEIE